MSERIWNLDDDARDAIQAACDAIGAVYDDDARYQSMVDIVWNVCGPGFEPEVYARSIRDLDEANGRDR